MTDHDTAAQSKTLQQDHSAPAEELLYIESVLQCLADEPVDASAEQDADDEGERGDVLMW
jgi:hypothetical protein